MSLTFRVSTTSHQNTSSVTPIKMGSKLEKNTTNERFFAAPGTGCNLQLHRIGPSSLPNNFTTQKSSNIFTNIWYPIYIFSFYYLLSIFYIHFQLFISHYPFSRFHFSLTIILSPFSTIHLRVRTESFKLNRNRNSTGR